MKEIFIGLAVVVGLVVVTPVVRAAFFPVHVANTVVTSAENIVDKTLNADNVLYNYEWFKQQYQDLNAIQAKIKLADASVVSFDKDSGPRSTWTFEDRTEHSRLSSISLGLKQQAEDMKATYNARSKMANRNIFKTGDLPESIL